MCDGPCIIWRRAASTLQGGDAVTMQARFATWALQVVHLLAAGAIQLYGRSRDAITTYLMQAYKYFISQSYHSRRNLSHHATSTPVVVRYLEGSIRL